MLPFFALDPKKTAQEARRLMEEGKWEKGYSLCKKALKTSPRDPDLLEVSIELALLLKNYKEAMGHFLLIKNFPEKRKRVLEQMVSQFGGEGKDKILLREQVILEFISEGEFERIENLFSLIPEKEKKHFFEKHSEKDEFVSQMFIYFILFYSKKYIESSLKLFEIYKKFKDKEDILRREILRVQNMGFLRKYASFTNFIINYSEGNEEKALEYIDDLLEDESFFPYLIKEFENREPAEGYFKLLFSNLLILKGERKKGLLFLRESLKDGENIDLNYAYNIVRDIKRESLDDEEVSIVSDILKELGKTEDAAEFLKTRVKKGESVITLRESLLKSFSARAFRILLEMEEEKIDENLEFLYENDPDYLNDIDVLNILKDFAEERNIKSDFFLFSLGSSLVRNGEYKDGIYILRFLLKKNFNRDLILKEFNRKRESLLNIPEGLLLDAEINLLEKKEEFFDSVKILITKFSNYSDYALFLLDEAGEIEKDLNDKIIDFLNKEKDKFSKKYLVVEGLSLIRKSNLREGVLKLYKAYIEGEKFVKDIMESIYKEDIPEYNFLRGSILLEIGKYEEAARYLKKAMTNKKLLPEISKVVTEKMRNKKDPILMFIYVNTLLLWNKFEESYKFINTLKEEIKDERMLNNVISLESIVLYKRGEKDKAKELIKSLLKEKKKFDPYFLYEFLKEEEKTDKSPFIYQTLGSLALLLSKPLEAVRYYFMLALSSPKHINKIKDIYLTIETKFTYFPEIDLYKFSLNLLEKGKNKDLILRFFEENPELKEEFNFFLSIYPETQKDPYLLYYLTKLNFEDGKEFEEGIIKSYELALNERLYDLLEEIKNFSYERIKNDEADEKLLFFILKRDLKDFNKFFKLLKEKGYIYKFPKESYDVMRDAFLKGLRDKDFIFTYADFLAERNDKGSIYLYQEALEKYPEEVDKRREKWEKFIPEGKGLSLILSMKFKHLERFKKELKNIIELKLEGTFYAIIKESLKVLDYDRELYELIKGCAQRVKDIDTEIFVLKELSTREKSLDYFKDLIEKLILFKKEELSFIWMEFVKVISENKRFDIIDNLWNRYFKSKKGIQVLPESYFNLIFLKDPKRFFRFLKSKRNFPLPLFEP